MTHLRNGWYAAAWADELPADGPLVRTIMEENVVFYRSSEVRVVAAANRCPHRFSSFDGGRVVDGTLECSYHGLRYDRSGQCIFNPDGNGRRPASARLKLYPLVERWGCVFLWMGEADAADADLLPDLPFLEDA